MLEGWREVAPDAFGIKVSKPAGSRRTGPCVAGRENPGAPLQDGIGIGRSS